MGRSLTNHGEHFQWGDEVRGIIEVGFMENGRRRIEDGKNRELF